MSPRPKKTDQHPNLSAAIKETAWKQIAGSGAPSLSLRAIARELGITAPAIYNYFPDRDALVTALITDAFTSLGATLTHAIQGAAISEHTQKLTTLGLAYRQWALTYPQRYQLIFGTPIPGYHAPDDITTPAAAWALEPLIDTLQASLIAGKLRRDQMAERTPELTAMLAAWSRFANDSDVDVLYAALVIWSRVHGLVSLEIGNQMPSFITDAGVVYCRELENINIQYLIDCQEE
ncbi:MAG: TetR/AcrR family transcriptional regulator [Anaerolineaceae bacterium]|nr:TetR/AcrR family transcriptional regulator [Anaerolineaceae bacterium]